MNQIRSSEKAGNIIQLQMNRGIRIIVTFLCVEAKSPIFQYWLSRGPSASNVIGADGIQAFKQAARTLHYCLTPIIFLPRCVYQGISQQSNKSASSLPSVLSRWRSEIALTRDNSIGIVKKSRTFSDPKQLGFQLKVSFRNIFFNLIPINIWIPPVIAGHWRPPLPA